MKKILIVDDEPAILTLLQYNLEAEHYQVETATDGQEALDKVRNEPFDFIILDLMLPSLSGLDVTRKIREDKIQTPIMILTAKDNDRGNGSGFERAQWMAAGRYARWRDRCGSPDPWPRNHCLRS